MNGTDHKTNFQLLVPKDGRFECPFAVRLDQVDPTVLQHAPAGDEGRALVRKYCSSVYLRSHGQTREILLQAVAVLRQKVERLAGEYEECVGVLVQTPQTITSRVEAVELPVGRQRWATFWWGFLLAIMALFTWVNIARFAANECQDWVLGLLYAAPLLFVPLVFKYVDEKAPDELRSRIRCVLLALFLISFAIFAGSFALRFGYTPSAEDLIRNPAAGSAGDMRAQLLAQIILDPLIGLVAYMKLRESLRTGSKEITNPDWLARMADAARLENKRLEAAEALGQHQGLLVQLEHCMESFCLVGESYWRALEEQRAQAERDRQEEERDFQERQAARRDRENGRRQWTAPWQSTPKRNGPLINPPLTQPNNRTNQVT